jgi:hypothetical protein
MTNLPITLAPSLEASSSLLSKLRSYQSAELRRVMMELNKIEEQYGPEDPVGQIAWSVRGLVTEVMKEVRDKERSS